MSQLAFSWVTPLISLGSRQQLQHEDMLPLPSALEPQHCRRMMWQQWHQASNSPHLLALCMRCLPSKTVGELSFPDSQVRGRCHFCLLFSSILPTCDRLGSMALDAKCGKMMLPPVTHNVALCSQAKVHAEEQAKQKGEQTRNLKISLWRALWTGFGWPYISLGLLKLFSDALNFAGAQSGLMQLLSARASSYRSDHVLH